MTIDAKTSLLNLYQELVDRAASDKSLQKDLDKLDSAAADRVAKQFFLKEEGAKDKGVKFHFSAKSIWDTIWGGIRKICSMGPSKDYNFDNNFKDIQAQFEEIKDPLSGNIIVQDPKEAEKLQKLQTILNALAQHVQGKKHPEKISKISQEILTAQVFKTKTIDTFLAEAPEKLKTLEIAYKSASSCFQGQIKQEIAKDFKLDAYKLQIQELSQEAKGAQESDEKWSQWNNKCDALMQKIDVASDGIGFAVEASDKNLRRSALQNFQQQSKKFLEPIVILRDEAYANGFLDVFDKSFALDKSSATINQLQDEATERLYDDKSWDDIHTSMGNVLHDVEIVIEHAKAFVEVQKALQNVKEAREIASRGEYKQLKSQIDRQFPPSTLDEPLRALADSLRTTKAEKINQQKISELVDRAQKMIAEPFKEQFVLRNKEINAFRELYGELDTKLQVLKAKVPEERKGDFDTRFPFSRLSEQLEQIQTQGFEVISENVTRWGEWQKNVTNIQKSTEQLIKEAENYLASPKLIVAPKVEVVAPAVSEKPLEVEPLLEVVRPLPTIKKAQTLLEVELQEMKKDLQLLSKIAGLQEFAKSVDTHLKAAPKVGTEAEERKPWDERAMQLQREFETLISKNTQEVVKILKVEEDKILEDIRHIPKKVLATLDGTREIAKLDKQLRLHLKAAEAIQKGEFKKWRNEQKELLESAKKIMERPELSPWIGYARHVKSRLNSYMALMEKQTMREGSFIGTLGLQEFFETLADPTFTKEQIKALQTAQGNFLNAVLEHEKSLTAGEQELGQIVQARRGAIADDQGETRVTVKVQSPLMRLDKVTFSDLRQEAKEAIKISLPQKMEDLQANWSEQFAAKMNKFEEILQKAGSQQQQLVQFEKGFAAVKAEKEKNHVQPALEALKARCGEVEATLTDDSAKRTLAELQKVMKSETETLFSGLSKRPDPLTVQSFLGWQKEFNEGIERNVANFVKRVSEFASIPQNELVGRSQELLAEQKKEIFDAKLKQLEIKAKSYVREEELEDETIKEIIAFPFLQNGIKAISTDMADALQPPVVRAGKPAPATSKKATWELYTDATASLDRLSKQITSIEDKIRRHESETLKTFNAKLKPVELLAESAKGISFTMPLQCIVNDLKSRFKVEMDDIEDLDDFVAWVDEVKVVASSAESPESFDKAVQGTRELLDYLVAGPFEILKNFHEKSLLYKNALAAKETLLGKVRGMRLEAIGDMALSLQLIEDLLKKETALLQIPKVSTVSDLWTILETIKPETLNQFKALHENLGQWLTAPVAFDVKALAAAFKRRENELQINGLVSISSILLAEEVPQRERLLKTFEQAKVQVGIQETLLKMANLDEKLSLLVDKFEEITWDNEKLGNLLSSNRDVPYNLGSMQIEIRSSLHEKKAAPQEIYKNILRACGEIKEFCATKTEKEFQTISKLADEIEKAAR